MDAPRLRRTVSLLAVAATAGAAAAIGAHPFPEAAPAPTADVTGAPPLAADASLAQREARAAARLDLAEQRLRALASRAGIAAATAAPAPVVSVAPPSSAPVTRSASS